MSAIRTQVLAAGLAAIVVGGFFLSTATAQPAPDHKITICHVPAGNLDNAHEITIDLNAWENGHTPHNSHAMDFVVDADHACAGTVETTTTTTEPEATTTTFLEV